MTKSELVKQLQEKIGGGELKMRPKYYFVLGSVSLAVGMFLSFALASLFVNIVFYRFRVYCPHNYLLEGKPRLFMFLAHFPWEHALMAVGLLVLGAWLLRKYDISYKKSVVVIAGGALVATLLVGVAVDRSGFNERALKHRMMKRVYEPRLENSLKGRCRPPKFSIPRR